MKNIKVMNTKPDVTDEEISSLMNFDALLEQHRHNSKKRLNGKTATVIVVFSFVMIAALISWFAIRSENESTMSVEKTPLSVKRKSLNDVVVSADSVDKTLSPSSIQKKPDATQSVKKPAPVKARDINPESMKDEEMVIEKIPAPVFVQAEPVAGYPDLYEYFSRELTYPLSRMKDSVSGVVAVVFTINTEGHPEKIEIEQSLGKDFDEEAIRVMQNMPLWNPATYNGKPVPSRMSLPLTFQVRKIK
jgi:TonB family protein